jgi:hypothetical protein
VLGGGRCYVVRGLFQPVLWIGIDRTLAGQQEVYAGENREGTLDFAISFFLHLRLLLALAIDGRIIDSMKWFLL